MNAYCFSLIYRFADVVKKICLIPLICGTHTSHLKLILHFTFSNLMQIKNPADMTGFYYYFFRYKSK
ncbi:hypothetical protein HX13_00075 [Chryseobacterium sp. P1-3]|nr:hypothetical protein HX13_00075 [Chryseobacterium sp. P1-3]